MNSASARFGDEYSQETLVLSGLKVDVIGFASKKPSVECYTGTDLKEDIDRKRKRRETTIATCQEWEQHVQKTSLEKSPYATRHGRREAFWRTLIADRDLALKGPPIPSDDFAGRFEAWIGGDVPFVLRKKEQEHGYWELVGEAYLHGIMDGSWVRKAVKEDVMDFRII
ncbi:hypothetical protein JMJ35_001857 [Cladonia borealis]|uniref:Uncharacterized protein n=1 Tax=Cladonia borealis TaxID=184061 RepID=A0AA39R6M2_9LECA|nr:hypothetical protein JMJ35_001857 [Cladonia borealis]